MDEDRENIIREIKNLKTELQERELSLPAHSIRPHQLLIIEELENRLHELEERLRLGGREKSRKERK
jgi:hypothetical protein